MFRPLFAASALCALAAGHPLIAGETGAEARDAATEATRAAITEYAKLRAEGQSYRSHELFDRPDRIEHNPDIADGLGGDEEFLERRRQAQPDKYGPTHQYVNIVHTILADGDLAAIKSHLFAKEDDPGREFVDIWRLENGKFAEHWDVIQPIERQRPNGSQIACGIGTTYADAQGKSLATVENPACGKPDPSADREANRKLVLDYMELGRQPGKLAEAVERYLSPDFVQHSADIPQGRQGLIDYLTPRMEALVAEGRNSHLGRVLADGDFVLVHRRVTSAQDPRGVAVADLFRVRGGQIVEHWDVRQPIPEFSVSGRSMVEGPLEPGRRQGRPEGH